MPGSVPPCTLVVPSLATLPSYRDALRRGWSSDNLRPQAGAEQLARAERDPHAFVAALDDPEGRGGPVTLPDGSVVPRLPGFRRWIWDGEVCGSIGFRWQKGGTALPPHVLGHIGYAVVPWKRGRGYARTALGLLLAELRAAGMPAAGLTHVELTTDPGNPASQRVITGNGGYPVERFAKLDAYGGGETLRFRIDL
ncbi:GNAT family N-acetyltransferase [Thalassobaculum sp.]|uniref:GNAT family N-acetyltransferase n=1 Tax=Thalassobaculum sp. TaxID=2022740 RepID=UPI0032EC373F